MIPGTVPVLLLGLCATVAHSAGILAVQARPDWTRRHAVALSAFAGGFCLGAALLHLIPEASGMSRWAPLAALCSFLALYFVETHLVRWAHHHGEDPGHGHADEEAAHGIRPSIGILSALAFGFHTLFDGLAIGVSFRLAGPLASASAIAVILHEFPEGIATYSLLVAAGTRNRTAALYSWAVALVDPLVAIASFFFLGPRVPQSLVGILLGSVAGSFIYIGASDLLPEVGHRARARYSLMILLGAAVAASLLLLGE